MNLLPHIHSIFLPEIHCPALQRPKNVVILPPTCGEEEVKAGDVCRLSCVHGYSLSGVTGEVQCLTSGKWSKNAHKAKCRGTLHYFTVDMLLFLEGNTCTAF